MASVFRGILDFFVELGVYDVILPFLLVFTIMFALLEKTKVLGMQEIDGKKYTRKNINSMVAFCVSFLVIASTRLVAIINETMANMFLLLLLAVSFLLLIGSFMKEEDESVFLEEPWKTIFMIIMFVGITLIFLHAIGWLQIGWDYLIHHYDSTVVGSIILMAIIIFFMYIIVREPKSSSSES
ncbi:MAG: hypothetical protein ACE5DM_00395 [Candidatus Nanoarchaeia archaeon]